MFIRLQILLLLFSFSYGGIQAQCNYEYKLLTDCGPTKNSYFTDSPKQCVKLGTNFLFASIMRCPGTPMTNLEVIFYNSCGMPNNKIVNQFHCNGLTCLPLVKVFSHTNDTAFIAVYGGILQLYKSSRYQILNPLFTDSSFRDSVVDVKMMPNGNIGVLYANKDLTGLKIYENGKLLYNYVNSPSAPIGFWISNFYGNKLVGHAIHLNSQFLEITLDSSGKIVSDTLFANMGIALSRDKYKFNTNVINERTHLAMAKNDSIIIFHVKNYDISAPILFQQTYVEEEVLKIFGLETLDSGEILVSSSPETFLWDKQQNLVAVMPSNPMFRIPGNSTQVTTFYNFESFHVTSQEGVQPNNLVFHVSGSYNQMGGGGPLSPVLLEGKTCFSQKGLLSINGMKEGPLVLPNYYDLSFASNITSRWYSKWFSNKPKAYIYSKGDNPQTFYLTKELFNNPSDSFRVCVVTYFMGTLPLKACKIGYLNPIANTDSLRKVSFMVYPNPVRAELFVSHDASTEMSSWELFSNTGELVQTGTSISNSIDFSNQAIGVYFLRIINKEETITTKIIKI